MKGTPYLTNIFLLYFFLINNNSSFYITDNESLIIGAGNNIHSFDSRIQQLFQKTKQNYPSYFDLSDEIVLSSQSLAFVIKKLQKINFIDSKSDANGIAFQKFLGRHAKGGRGQFFTPDPIIDFCV